MDIIKRYMKKLAQITNMDEMKILPGHLAFYLVLSLIPAVTLVGMVCNMLGISNADVIEFFDETAPTGVVEIIKPFFTSSGANMALIYLIIGFILISNGAYAIILASNTLYKIEDTSQLKGRIKAFFLTILLMFLFVFILTVLAFGNEIGSFILELEAFGSISNSIYNIFIYLKWPVAFIVIYIIIKMIYTVAPDQNVKSKSVTKGSIFTTICWLLITAIYSFYANNIARYDMFYGNLSNIIILMMWIYVIAYIFVIGIAINVNNHNIMEENVNNNKQ